MKELTGYSMVSWGCWSGYRGSLCWELPDRSSRNTSDRRNRSSCYSHVSSTEMGKNEKSTFGHSAHCLVRIYPKLHTFEQHTRSQFAEGLFLQLNVLVFHCNLLTKIRLFTKKTFLTFDTIVRNSIYVIKSFQFQIRRAWYIYIYAILALPSVLFPLNCCLQLYFSSSWMGVIANLLGWPWINHWPTLGSWRTNSAAPV